MVRNDLGKHILCARLPRNNGNDVFLTRKIRPEWLRTHQSGLRPSITGEENWCFANDPETKRQSAQRAGENN